MTGISYLPDKCHLTLKVLFIFPIYVQQVVPLKFSHLDFTGDTVNIHNTQVASGSDKMNNK